ncbi:MAG: UDP-N-acetylmuramoyl-L-alanine--D-glutamate ligase [Cryomorphaceae bacterium]|nr:UDP-N-acetylmuramoyl-L-alanine--D-glutamate ligase [Flavobacteriales bacterium]
MKMLIFGGGESGTGAALLGRKLGYDVFVTDSGKLKESYKSVLTRSGVRWEEGGHTGAFTEGAEFVVKSPGIPSTAAAVSDFRRKGIEVISEIEFAARHTKGKMIAITGTNGKTTTTLLTHHIFAKAGVDVAVAGNVGKSFAGLLAEGDHEYWVLEVSSFQLDDIVDFKPEISILLNITPDHLDRYGNSIDAYADAKFRVTENQGPGQHFIYCADDPLTAEGLKRHKINAEMHPVSLRGEVENGAYTAQDNIIINLHNKSFTMSIHDLALQGKHNAYNSMAASVAARIFEIRKEIVRESLSDFQNIEHRLEFVAEIHGIKFINDSKATNVNSTWYALESLDGPVVWIVGGVDKGNDYTILEPLVREKVKAVICLGKDNKKLLDFFGPIVENIAEAGSAAEAVGLAYHSGEKGDSVILSPACASFDLFENYEERGHLFKTAVRAL